MSRPVVAVVDYGAGNLGNVRRALDALDVPHVFVREPAALPDRGPILLPGVGAFGAAMTSLRRSGLDHLVRVAAFEGRMVLGICLGLQLLFSRSEESGGVTGLGILDGGVRRLNAGGLPLPHLGWAPVGRAGLPCYFAHSYRVCPDDPSVVVATAAWCEPFPAAVAYGPVIGYQFHPERSGRGGLELLARTLRERRAAL